MMATAGQKTTSTARTANDPNETSATATGATQADLEADIARLREDIAAIARQIGATGGHSYAFAKRAAGEGVDALKAKSNDFEQQVTETVREKPLTSLAIAAGVGFIFALLTSR